MERTGNNRSSTLRSSLSENLILESIFQYEGLVPETARDKISESVFVQLLESAIQAPSGGNSQPWRWVRKANRVYLFHDDRYSNVQSLLDYNGYSSFIGLGAAVENFRLRAAALGFRTEIAVFPLAQPHLVAVIETNERESGDQSADFHELSNQIGRRGTCRGASRKASLSQVQMEKLTAATESVPQVTLKLLTRPEDLDRVGGWTGRATSLRLLNKDTHGQFVDEVRWNREEAEASRDGIDIRTLGLSSVDKVLFSASGKWKTIQWMKKLNLGSKIIEQGRSLVTSSSSIGFIRVRNDSPAGFFYGGMAMQRCWLQTTEMGFALQPLELPYFFNRLIKGGGQGLPKHFVDALRGIRDDYARLFDMADGDAEIALFRLFQAKTPTVRSLRRPLESVYTNL
jgi:hypothetical protein